MATRDEVIQQYAKLPAFRGLITEDIGVYLDLALEAVEGYAPKKVKMKNIPGQESARYDVPSGAKTLLGAFITNTNIRIEMREETEPNGDRTYLLLQIQVPSYIDLVRDEQMVGQQSYPTPYAQGYRYGFRSGYSSHDLEYTTALSVEDLSARHSLALRLYAESEAYQYQATKISSLSDITDREASGALTSIRRSQSGNAFRQLSDDRAKAFRREVARPYWAVDSFGLTEYLWNERRT